MQEIRLAIVVVLAALAMPLAAPGVGAQGALPEGCEAAPEGLVCAWSFEQDAAAVPTQRVFEAPGFPRTLATITVLLDGVDRGWRVSVHELAGDAYAFRSYAEHPPAPDPRPRLARESSAHAFEIGPGARVAIAIVPAYEGPLVPVPNAWSPASSGRFQVTYVAEALAPGEAPVRPAATRDDPHLADARGTARRPEYDVRAAWLDDARVGDGLFEARLAVEDLEGIDLDGLAFVMWTLNFTVQGREHFVRWFALPGNETTPIFWGSNAGFVEGGAITLQTYPTFELDVANATFSALLPERIVGEPGAGTLFDPITAKVYTRRAELRDYTQIVRPFVNVDLTVEERATRARYAFALGGPDVWDALNPRLAVPADPWYEDPLASENVADSLQVAGAATASVTFVGGLALVRRRRARAKALLAEVDAVVRGHGADARRALLALGELEARLDARYRRGDLSESEHQIVSQRIATAATRFALRRELGLDDGDPGENDLVARP